jgi:tetratricopeptide (TPR) repeat protein
VKSLADPKTAVAGEQTPESQFWSALTTPGQAAKAAQIYRDARKRDPQASLAPEQVVNLVAYERMQTDRKEAIELAKLNVELYPNSANAYDSLGDAYLADGQNDLALQLAEKALELLPSDKADETLKKAIRESAEGKIKKLKAAQ